MTDRSAKSSPAVTRAPQQVRTRRELAAFQRHMAHTLFLPLAPDDTIAATFVDGRPMEEVAAEFIRPSDRLTALERLEIYARCYWYRITASVYEDCPGLRALLGEARFAALVRAFLVKFPSRSFTLRNLCARLPRFIAAEPAWTAPHSRLAYDIARFEWAQTQVFDSAALPPLPADSIASTPPHRLRIALQPHLTLLASDWPVDRFVIAVKTREAQRAEASNTVTQTKTRRPRRAPVPARKRTYIVVHRYKHRVYYKRVSAAGFAILSALDQGKTLTAALTAGGPRASAAEIRRWFATWMELGWFCRRTPSRNKRVVRPS